MPDRTIVLVKGSGPKWDRAFSCLSELQAQSLVSFLAKNDIIAAAVTIDEYNKEAHHDKHEEADAEASEKPSPTSD